MVQKAAESGREEGVTLILGITESGVRQLNALEGKAYFGLSRITFKYSYNETK